ncbi:hypothetical protein BC828DRAFT_393397 [Blastocladiella britannica]|nr:hypothetical protein BC828DRAFT_393397 [Blastocladiella britannica]
MSTVVIAAIIVVVLLVLGAVGYRMRSSRSSSTDGKTKDAAAPVAAAAAHVAPVLDHKPATPTSASPPTRPAPAYVPGSDDALVSPAVLVVPDSPAAHSTVPTVVRNYQQLYNAVLDGPQPAALQWAGATESDAASSAALHAAEIAASRPLSPGPAFTGPLSVPVLSASPPPPTLISAAEVPTVAVITATLPIHRPASTASSFEPPATTPTDPEGWPAPGLAQFAATWALYPYIAGTRTCRQAFSGGGDELNVAQGDDVYVTLVFSDGWASGYKADDPGRNEGVFPLCVLAPVAGDHALLALEQDLMGRTAPAPVPVPSTPSTVVSVSSSPANAGSLSPASARAAPAGVPVLSDAARAANAAAAAEIPEGDTYYLSLARSDMDLDDPNRPLARSPSVPSDLGGNKDQVVVRVQRRASMAYFRKSGILTPADADAVAAMAMSP